MKKYDIFGKEVNIGDDVIIIEPYYHNFVNAKVIKLTPKGFRVKYYPDNDREKETVAFEVINCKALDFCDYLHHGRLAKSAYRITTRQQAKIEREINQIKFEAIKEFAEKLKEKCYEDFQETYEMLSPYVTDDDIDKLVKEMTEEE